MQVVSICLSDIPKENITKANNGKSYINLVVETRRQADKYGNTLTVYVSQTKEERTRRENKTYVGSGKEYFNQYSHPQNQSTQIDSGDDLGF